MLKNMQNIFRYVQYNEERFAEMLLSKSKEDEKKELSSKRRDLEKARKRIAELNNLFLRAYEDNVSGKLSDERYEFLFILPMRVREKNSMREYLFLKKKYPKERNKLPILRNS